MRIFVYSWIEPTNLKKVRQIVCLCFLLCYSTAYSQNLSGLDWMAYTYSNSQAEITATATDLQGNIYIAGIWDASDIIWNNKFGGNLYVKKLTPDSVSVWTKSYTGRARITNLTVNSSGDVYMNGTFKQMLQFDQKNILTRTTAEPYAFSTKLYPNGSIAWIDGDTSPGSCGTGITTTDDGLVYETRISQYTNGIIRKLNPFGAEQGSFTLPGVHFISDIVAETDGKVYIAASAMSNLSIDTLPNGFEGQPLVPMNFILSMNGDLRPNGLYTEKAESMNDLNYLHRSDGDLYWHHVNSTNGNLTQCLTRLTPEMSIVANVVLNPNPGASVEGTLMTADDKGNSYLAMSHSGKIFLYQFNSTLELSGLISSGNNEATVSSLTCFDKFIYLSGKITNEELSFGSSELTNRFFTISKHDLFCAKFHFNESENTSVSPVPSKEDITVYPVPPHGNEIFIRTGSDALQYKVHLLDINGRRIETTSSSSNGLIMVRIPTLPSGTYLLQLFDGKTLQTRAIVIH